MLNVRGGAWLSLVISIVSCVATAEVPAVLLEEAIRREQTAGDIDAAMKLYQQVVDEAEIHRPAQAEALYRLASCYERKGDPSRAVELLKKLVLQYPEESPTLASARQAIERLAPAPKRDAVPYVLKTVPEAFAQDVMPGVLAMSVTFSEPMADGSWSWTGGGETFPQGGKPFYDARRTTCTRRVTLQPAKVYWVGVNSPSFRNFASAQGVPAPWYIICFATRSVDGKPTPIPQDLLEQARKINQAHIAARTAAGIHVPVPIALPAMQPTTMPK